MKFVAAPTSASIVDDAAVAPGSSYGQILKSSVLIGSSSVVNLLIGIVRIKAMAVILGPAGIGLIGLFSSIIDVAKSIATMGVQSSGVRQIADAVGTGEPDRVARTITVLRRLSIVLGLMGAGALAVLSKPIAVLTFGDDRHHGAVALLSLAVLCGCIAGGQSALIQGMRRIADLAKLGMWGALLGTVISVPMVYMLGEDGIAPALVAVAAASIATSWWYSRKVRIARPLLTFAGVRREGAQLLSLGVAFMASAFLMLGAAYAVRIILLRTVGLEATGLYEAAWTLGGLYVAFVMQAMGADFYPRLVGVAKDNAVCNRLVNEQTHVSLLLAGPGVIATLTFASLIIMILYTPKFVAAAEVLRWICLGMALRVISWPMGYIIVAKGRPALFLGAEVAWALANVCLAWICIRRFGVAGAGIAFLGAYIFHVFLIYVLVQGLFGFRWSTANKKLGLLFLFSIAVVFACFLALPVSLAIGVGALALLLSGIYSVRSLLNLVALDVIPPPLMRLFHLLRLRPIQQ